MSGPGRHKYGIIGDGSRSDRGSIKSIKAHRYAYERAHGPIPHGLHIDHLCRNTKCVNPNHLEAVAPIENYRRGVWKVRTHCQRGHALTADNVYLRPTGARQCRVCKKAINNAHYARHNKPLSVPQYAAGLLGLAFC